MDKAQSSRNRDQWTALSVCVSGKGFSATNCPRSKINYSPKFPSVAPCLGLLAVGASRFST